MITEQYVTFDTAKMLKKAGFDCRVNRYFQIPYFSGEAKEKSMLTAINNNRYPRNYSRPTQAVAARWLREVYHYAVCIWFTKDHEKWFYAYRTVFDTDYNISEYKYDSYEAALEAGLQECLKLIIKRNMGEKSLRLGV